jgi:hypothetical protein
MSADRPPLTDEQLALLRWIADGCPEGVWPDHSHKGFMRVLEMRALAATRRWYGKWGAELLPAGAFYLAHGTYPEDEPAEDIPAAQPRAERPRTAPTPPPSSTPRPGVPKPAAAPKLNGSQQLIKDVLDAGGNVRLEPATDKERASLTTRLRLAERKGYIPDGKELRLRHPEYGVFDIAIVDQPEWKTAQLAPIPVRRSLDHLHSAVEKLRDTDGMLGIERTPVRNRALRLMQALTQAAMMKKVKVSAVRQHNMWDHRSRRDQQPGQIQFEVDGHRMEVRISQVMEHVEHKPTPEERRWFEQYGTRIKKWDSVPSTRLQIVMPGRFSHHGTWWADHDDRRLEDLLPQILHEMGLRAEEAARDRIRQEEAQRQAKEQRDERLAQAAVRMIEAGRVKLLHDQADAWRRSRELADYVNAMEQAVADIEDPAERAAADEWLSWARVHADLADPLQGRLAMPPEPEPSYTNVKPFLIDPSDFWG